MPNQPKTPIRSVRIDDATWQSAQATAAKNGDTMTDVIRRALIEYVTRHAPQR